MMNALAWARRALILLAVAAALFPLAWMANASLRPHGEILRAPWALAAAPSLTNYREVWLRVDFGRAFANSLLITAGAVAVLTLVGALAGFAFARYRFPGQRLLWGLFLAGLFLPIHACLIPLYRGEALLGIGRSGWSQLYLAAVYVAFNLSFTIYLLHRFFRQLPPELDEAARVDGCSGLRLWWYLYLPLSLPALTVTALVNAVMIWNEFAFALVLLPASRFQTLPLIVKSFADETGQDLGLTTAAMTLATLPIVALFLATQRWLITGMTSGAVKG
jgi:raffinose/stachyose/melibiose transport system permease protein